MNIVANSPASFLSIRLIVILLYDRIDRRQVSIYQNFVDFPPSVERDRLLAAINNLPQLAGYILSADETDWNYVVNRYFLPRHFSAVRKIFENLQNQELWENIEVSGEDVYNVCTNTRSGYVANVIDGQNGCFRDSFLHICEGGVSSGYKYSNLRDLRCNMFGSDLRLSYKMLSFEGWVLLHEFM